MKNILRGVCVFVEREREWKWISHLDNIFKPSDPTVSHIDILTLQIREPVKWIPLCKATVNGNSPYCQEPKCSPHSVQTYQKELLKGCPHHTKPGWKVFSPPFLFMNLQVNKLVDTFVPPTVNIFVCAYASQPWAFDCLDSWRMTRQCLLGHLTSSFTILKMITATLEVPMREK